MEVFFIFIFLCVCVVVSILLALKKNKKSNKKQPSSIDIHSPFDYMPQWEHNSSKQKERQNRALLLSDRIISIDYNNNQLKIKNDQGDGSYTASLIGCTCEDFTYRRQPCKHMYCLAFALYNKNNPSSIPTPVPERIGNVHSDLLKADKIQQVDFSRFIAFDTETTGLSVNKDRIIEIGAVVFENSIPTDQFSSLINPHILTTPEAEAVNHISQTMINTAPDEKTVIHDFLTFLGDAAQGRTVLVAHNAKFDRSFLDETLKRLGVDAELVYIDSLYLAREFLPSLPNYKLQTVADYYGITNEDAHRATSDAETCGKVLLKMLPQILKQK